MEQLLSIECGETDKFAYTASNELIDNTYGRFVDAYNDLASYDIGGVVLKHRPYDNGDPIEIECVVYEYNP